MEWIYQHNADNSARFVLGTVGANPLVCFGINPSTAVPNKLDRTVSRVSKFATSNGYDSWVMLNVYPQIATNPDGLHPDFLPELKAENERQISEVLEDGPQSLLAAWGGLITKRNYLQQLLRDILRLPEVANRQWVRLGSPTIQNHPRHPLYVKSDSPLSPFSVGHYL